MRSFLFADILVRTLRHSKYDVSWVMNITDVGHLTDDGNDGEDKMEKGSRREGKTAWEIAEHYTKRFLADWQALNMTEPDKRPKATDHIEEQINQVQILTDKGFTYETSDGIYFDTSKDPNYGEMVNLEGQELEAGKRVDMGEKRNASDFALWKFTREGETRQMEWEAFGRKGFPGWHIECSAMSIKYLGEQFAIHTGGVDHKPVHHTNEIAQAEHVTGKRPWVDIWMHNEFLNVTGEKMSKSAGEFLTVRTLVEKGYDPLAYRYFLLQAHYRKQLTFSWEAMDAAAAGLNNLRDTVKRIAADTADNTTVSEQFFAAMENDLNTAEALAILQTGLKSGDVSTKMVQAMDTLLGLNLVAETKAIPAEIQTMLDNRTKAREDRNWAESDRLRDELAAAGFAVEDTADGQRLL